MTAAELSRYRDEIKSSAEASRRYVLRRLAEEGAGLDVAGRRELAIEVIQDATGVYGDRAQATAAELFDEVMEADGVDARARMFDDLIDYGRTEGSMHYAARKLVDGDVAGFDGNASDLAAYYVHRSAWSNLVNNCNLHHIMWARVPTGEETCDYCLMLASRGFAYHSQAAASHKHTGCDCVVVPGNSRSTIVGYDPDDCFRRYEELVRENGPVRISGESTHSGSGYRRVARAAARRKFENLGAMSRYLRGASDMAELEARSAEVDIAFRAMFGEPSFNDSRWADLRHVVRRKRSELLNAG